MYRINRNRKVSCHRETYVRGDTTRHRCVNLAVRVAPNRIYARGHVCMCACVCVFPCTYRLPRNFTCRLCVSRSSRRARAFILFYRYVRFFLVARTVSEINEIGLARFDDFPFSPRIFNPLWRAFICLIYFTELPITNLTSNFKFLSFFSLPFHFVLLRSFRVISFVSHRLVG